MIAGASEGGADVFKFKYMEGSRFERLACLAQSPQLYKQVGSAHSVGLCVVLVQFVVRVICTCVFV
jgi:aspartyl/asparaginyl-tRNA synthetase